MSTPKIIALQLQATALLEAVRTLDEVGYFNVRYEGKHEVIVPSGPRHHGQLRGRMLNDWAKLRNRIQNHELKEAAREIKVAPREAVPLSFEMDIVGPGPKKRITRCESYREQDEMYCPHCNIRWSVDEDKPLTAQCLG